MSWEMCGRSMEMRRRALALTAVVWFASAPTGIAQEAKPQETTGVSIDWTIVLNLAEQIPELGGYALRMRKVTLEPGAVIAHHSHASRPIVGYVLSGEYTEVRDEGPALVRGPGDHWAEGADVAHWGANRGQVSTVMIGVDVVPEN